MGVACLLVGGPNYSLEVNGKVIRFEMHHYCGPMPHRSVGPRHMFWVAVTWWHRQGQRVDASGRCIYDWPPHQDEVMERIVGNHWRMKEGGDDLGFDLDDIVKYGRRAGAHTRGTR